MRNQNGVPEVDRRAHGSTFKKNLNAVKGEGYQILYLTYHMW